MPRNGITGLVEACDDPNLFDFPLWPGQRGLLEAFESAYDQGDWLAVWNIGRRSGKSTLAAVVALWSCLLRPDLDGMAGIAGQSQAVVISPSEKQARLLVKMARDLVQRSPLLGPLLERDTASELDFVNGTRLSAFPASARNIRGWPFRCLILDEASSFFDNDSGAEHQIDEVFGAALPSTAQFQGRAPVIVASTPKGDANWFAAQVRAGEQGNLTRGRVYHAPSPMMNPTLTAEFLESEEKRDPENYRGEYMAELVGSGGAFIDPELIDECVAVRDELPPDACDHWVAGIDPAFTRDPFALVICGRDREDRDRIRVGCVRTWLPPKRKPGTSQELHELENRVLSEVCDVMTRYRVSAVVHDQHQAAVIAEYIRRRGLWPEKYNLSSGSKLDVFTNLKARVVARTLELYEHSLLVMELKRVRAKQTAAGRAIETPSLGGTHCDTSIALALAVGYIDRGGAPGIAMPLVVYDETPAPVFGMAAETERQSISDYMARVF